MHLPVGVVAIVARRILACRRTMVVEIRILTPNAARGDPFVFLTERLTVIRIGIVAIGLARLALSRNTFLLPGADFLIVAVRVTIAGLNDGLATAPGEPTSIASAALPALVGLAPGAALSFIEFTAGRLAASDTQNQHTQTQVEATHGDVT
jgi:hypothetical protein